MATQVLAGYPQSMGAKIMSTAVVDGPAIYAAGGFQIEAVSYGMQYIEQVIVSTPRTTIILADLVAHARLHLTAPVASATTAAICVIAVNTGLEVAPGTDLSTRQFVITVLGF